MADEPVATAARGSCPAIVSAVRYEGRCGCKSLQAAQGVGQAGLVDDEHLADDEEQSQAGDSAGADEQHLSLGHGAGTSSTADERCGFRRSPTRNRGDGGVTVSRRIHNRQAAIRPTIKARASCPTSVAYGAR